MGQPAKFLFERAFTATGAEPQKEAAHEAAVAAARAEGYAAGEAAGLKRARAETATEVAEVLNRIAAELSKLGEAQRTEVARHGRDAMTLAVTVAHKLAPALMARMPEVEVAALVQRCLGDLSDEPRVVIRAAEATSEALKPYVREITANAGFPGHIVLLPDDALVGADCRIEWADGGVERDVALLSRLIDDAVGRYLHSEFDMPPLNEPADPAGIPASGTSAHGRGETT